MTVFRVSPHVEVGRATYKYQSWREALQYIVEVWGQGPCVPAALQPCHPVQHLYRARAHCCLLLLPPRALVGLADDSELTFPGVAPPPQPGDTQAFTPAALLGVVLRAEPRV